MSAHTAEPFAEMHPLDAAEHGISDADLVELSAENGARVVLRALLSDRQTRGSVFVPMHWTGETASLGRIDALVAPVTDPVSGQPASKHIAVAARRYAARAYGFAVSTCRPEGLGTVYWASARADDGWRIELGFDEAVADWESWARRVFGIPAEAEIARYVDLRSGDCRIAFFAEGRLLAALFISAEPVAVSRSWAVSQLSCAHTDAAKRPAIVAGRPGADRPDTGAIVCSCFAVGVNQIAAAARKGCRSVEAIGAVLSAGTNCGSCRSEIGRIIDATQTLAAE